MDLVSIVTTSMLTVVAAGSGAYIGSRLRKAGEIDAVNSRLDDVLKQTAALAQITATINTQVARLDWGEREVVTLRRTKLEELLLALYQADDYVGSRLQFALDGKKPEYRDESLHKIQVLTALYFQELTTDVAVFVSAYLAATRASIEVRSAALNRDHALANAKLIGQMLDPAEFNRLMAVVQEKATAATELYAEPLTKARAMVEGKAGGLINKIVGQDIGREMDYSRLFAAEEQQTVAKEEFKVEAPAPNGTS